MTLFIRQALVLLLHGYIINGQDFTVDQINQAVAAADRDVQQRQIISSSREARARTVAFSGNQGPAATSSRQARTGLNRFNQRNDPPRNAQASRGGEVTQRATLALRSSSPASAATPAARSLTSLDPRAPAAGFSAGSTRAFRNAAAAACMDVIPAKACDPFQRYRETDGQCNNLFYRSEPNGAFKLGAAFTAQGRFLFPDYDNGVNSPRVRSVIQPFVLPNARFVSLSAHSGTAFQSDRHTPFLTHFGQFIDHDIVSTPEVETVFIGDDNPHCCVQPNIEGCFPIRFAPDNRLRQLLPGAPPGTCIPFQRADTAPSYYCDPGPRLQQNQRSSFIDGTMIYGMTDEKESSLRDPVDLADSVGVQTEISSDEQREISTRQPMIVDDVNGPRFLPIINFETVTTDDNGPSKERTDVDADHSYSRVSLVTDHTEADETSNACTQTDLTFADLSNVLLENEQLKKKLEDKDTLFKDIFVEKVTKSDESIRRFTGLPNLEVFNFVKDTAIDLASKMKYWTGSDSTEEKRYQSQGDKPGPSRKLSMSDELIMTLVRFRLALPVYVMAHLFGVSGSRVSSVFTTWMFCLFHIFKGFIIWPSRELIKKFMPSSFLRTFPRTRAIIDCSEIFIQRPRNPSTNARTYSTYKSHNTVKFLVSITATGAFNFISEVWGGNTSDRHITMHRGFLELVSPGDEIMADRGFTIRDLLTERKAYLTIPPFTRKCKWGKGRYLSVKEICKTRQIANLRIHVERAIQRLKTFKLISQTIPWNMKSLIHPMVVVAAFFCNLQKPLVKKN